MNLPQYLLVLYALFTPAWTLRSNRQLTQHSFLVLGDWGGVGLFPYFTPRERHVGVAMGQIAEKISAKYVVSLGDNFYFNGIRTNEHDSRFKHTFEEIFYSKNLQVPWLICAGNHDHFGNVSAQIAYTKISNRWVFPALYWTETFSFDGQTIQWVMIDTPTLVRDFRGIISDFAIIETPGIDSQFAAPVNLEQLNWIENVLSTSEADYLMVAGHYPIYSIAEHGTDERLVKHLKPLLEKHNVTAYFNGHDHNLQHISPKNSHVNYFVSGAGSFADESTQHIATIPNSSLRFHWPSQPLILDLGGFLSGTALSDKLAISFHDSTGRELYETLLYPRNNREKRFIRNQIWREKH